MRFYRKMSDFLWLLTAFAPLFSLLTYGRYEYTTFAFSWFADFISSALTPYLGTLPEFPLVVASHVVIVYLIRCAVDLVLCIPQLMRNMCQRFGGETR